MSRSGDPQILTLEPLIEVIRSGVEGAGWELSGLQKTTSHQFEGRWEGESTRSAYLFFHDPSGPDFASIDVYLDETDRGVSGNLALVVDLVQLGQVGSVQAVLASLAAAAARELGPGPRRPVTLRLRLEDAEARLVDAETEVRFKVRLPGKAIRSGAPAVAGLVSAAMGGFATLLASADVQRLVPPDLSDAGLG